MFLNIFLKEPPNFARKLSDNGIIHPQISMTKYLCFQYNVTYCSRHLEVTLMFLLRVHETIQPLTLLVIIRFCCSMLSKYADQFL